MPCPFIGTNDFALADGASALMKLRAYFVQLGLGGVALLAQFIDRPISQDKIIRGGDCR